MGRLKEKSPLIRKIKRHDRLHRFRQSKLKIKEESYGRTIKDKDRAEVMDDFYKDMDVFEVMDSELKLWIPLLNLWIKATKIWIDHKK